MKYGHPPMLDEIKPGEKFVDIAGGRVTVRGEPRRVAGGYVVDVESVSWNGATLPWTACVQNLRWR